MTTGTPHERSSAPSLHRLLIRRLVGMTLAICTLVGGAVYANEASRYDDLVLLGTLQAAEDFRQLILTHLDKPELDEAREIQAALDAIPKRADIDELGRTVYVRILDPNFNLLAQRYAPGSPQLAEVGRYVAEHRYPFSGEDFRAGRKLVSIGGRPYLHLGMAFNNSSGQRAVYAESLYAISDKVLQELAQGALRSAGLAVLVVLATTLLLYPVIIRLLRRVTRLSAYLQDANLETLSVLGGAIAKRDSDTDQHNYRVTLYAVRLAEALGLDARAIRSLIKGALLHDVGKIGIRDAILLKPGKLTEAEFAEMRTHVRHGWDIVAPAGWLRDAGEVILGHHERWDGAGYDSGLSGAGIPLNARLFAIVDVFDALTSRRPYKVAMSFEDSLAMLRRDRGTHFDPDILDVFTSIAQELYDGLAGSEAAALRAQLRVVLKIYFTRDIDDMAEGMPTEGATEGATEGTEEGAKDKDAGKGAAGG